MFLHILFLVKCCKIDNSTTTAGTHSSASTAGLHASLQNRCKIEDQKDYK